MSLATGEIVNKAPGYWTELPIPDHAIARVEFLAKDQGQPTLQDSNFLPEFSPDQVIDEDEYDRDYEFESDTDKDLLYDTEAEEAPSAGEALDFDGSFEEEDVGFEVDGRGTRTRR